MTDGIAGVTGRPLGAMKPTEVKQSEHEVLMKDAKANATGMTLNDSDRVELSAEATQELDKAGFDAAKVEQIKQALADGNYPVDARRIAEGFHEFEKLL